MFKPPPMWPLYTAVVLLSLVAFSKIVVAYVHYDLNRPGPKANFYSQEAYDDCGAMMAEARKMGFDRWTCHVPGHK